MSLALALSFAALLLRCSLALLWSRWPAWLKAMLVPGVAVTQTEWYCAGVGRVKLQGTEPAKSTFLTGGALALELIEWQ